MTHCFLKTNNPIFWIKIPLKDKDRKNALYFSKSFCEIVTEKPKKETSLKLDLRTYKDLIIFENNLPFDLEIYKDKIFY